MFLTAILALGLMSVANANEAMEGVQQDRIAPIVAWGIRYTTWGAFSKSRPINNGVGIQGVGVGNARKPYW
ncbi:hypothetical protein [Helicobacter apodemus]|uniref:Uncharacterized protein n=1 Tax=Helicobacter apodemus TaxID=135569 RepID=A0A2U8FDU2_9HELI|nr:hypothetical protein [Helicobacter apodemus]AWI34392.1 hypothetical protein CDV25_06185 [Helicobacter apodemus]